MRHTVVISDIHLCEVEREQGLWMRYRQAPYGPDQGLVDMLGELLAKVGDDRLTLVLNGDVFDFDAPRVVDGVSAFHDLPRDAEHTVPVLRAILDDHPAVLAALGAVLAAGHELVVVAGNHDVQMTLPEVRAELQAALVRAAAPASPEGREAIAARVLFRSWFHRTCDGIVIEHGSQYDSYCAYRYPMAPLDAEGKAIQPTMGSLASRNLTSRMGFFNPHVEGSYMLSATGYFFHWLRRYAFTRHSLVLAWMAGSLRTVGELVRVKQRASRARRRANIEAAMRETGAAFREVVAHARLYARPAEELMHRVLRELWLDRLAILGLSALLGAVWLLAGPRAAAAWAASSLVGFLVYEKVIPKPPLDETWRAVERAARKVARVHRAAAVVFGHTHKARGHWENGVFLGNSGSWSAAYRDIECTQPLETTRPVVWLRSVGGKLQGGLVRWQGGEFLDEASAERGPGEAGGAASMIGAA